MNRANDAATPVPTLDAVVEWDLHSAPAPTAQHPLPLLLGLKSGWRQPGSLLDQIAPAAYQTSELFATVRVRSLDEMSELQRGASSAWVERIASGRARSAPSVPFRSVSKSAPRPKLRGTVVAVIDDCCAFAHERFRFRDASGAWQPRIKMLWDQGRGDDRVALPLWQHVPEFGYGREIDAAGLRQLFEGIRSGGAIDEDQLYRLADHRDMERLDAHGTHVLDLAAGADPHAEQTPREPQIVFVQLPEEMVGDTSGHWLAVNVVDALRYVHERVELDANLVVNLSYGALAGPHDGTQAIEQFIEHLHALRPRNFAIVLPAGNGFEAACHASASASPGAPAEFIVDVRGDDPTHSFVDLWTATDADASFRVWAPDGALLDQNEPRLKSASGELLAELVIPTRNGGSRSQAQLCIKPVVKSDGGAHRALVGRWRLFAENRAPAAGPLRIDAWIERDEPVRGSGHPQAWQAMFVDVLGSDARPNDRTATLNSIANGPCPIVVGACLDASNPTMCDYSGSGPTFGTRRGPDVVALGDETAWLPGICAAGTRSAYTFRMRGTSVAAPQVTRWIARWLSEQTLGQSLEQIRAALLAQARTRPVRDPVHVNDDRRRGSGFIA